MRTESMHTETLEIASYPKDLLRAEMKSRRAQLAGANPLAGDDLAEAAVETLDFTGSWPRHDAVIAGYWPIQSEINPFPLMQMFEERGYDLALPVLNPTGSGYRMAFRRFSLGEPLVPGPFGIREPGDIAPEVEPDVLLMPMLAFDEDGVRLGYGGGYYDRAVAQLRASKPVRLYGVAFSAQQLAQVPFEVHDQKLDGIFTETGLIASGSIA
ncbi:MAG: 5-formyltetrahydrofolate cyclo-ligase [Asticcacaulis sp.]